MKIIIAGFPGVAISMSLIKSDLEMEEIEPRNVWLNDFIPTLGKLIEENDIDEIIFFGQQDFILGLAKMAEENINADVTYTIMDSNDIELEEDDEIDE